MDDYRKQFEVKFPPLIDDVREAHMLLAEKLYGQTTPFLTGCTSYVSRKMQCGYTHATAILEFMEELGGITPADDKGARQLKPLHRSP